MAKIEVMAILEQFVAHQLTMKDAADRIHDIYHPEAPRSVERNEEDNQFYHWVDCTSKGKVTVYHVSSCEGGEECRLFRYLSTADNMEQHLKRNKEYEVSEANGVFMFKLTGDTRQFAPLAVEALEVAAGREVH